MRIGFIGAGKNAQTMSAHLLAAGQEVVLSNSRGPETLAATVASLGRGATAGTRDDVLAADVVVLAVNWVDAKRALDGARWDGKILVDATNAHAAFPPDLSLDGVRRSIAALGNRTSSEIIAEWVPGARLVKSISNMPMNWIPDVRDGKPRTVMFVAGDDEEAKQVVKKLLDLVGFVGIDLGKLREGGALFQLGGPLSGLELHLNRRLR